MKRRTERIGISKIVGEALLKSDNIQSAYLALRQLLCARCGKVINEGDYFTRKLLPGVQIPISPRCQECVPFELKLFDEKAESSTTKEKSELLKSLLESDDKKTINSSATEDKEIEEKFLSRLGPALEKTRRTKFKKD